MGKSHGGPTVGGRVLGAPGKKAALHWKHWAQRTIPRNLPKKKTETEKGGQGETRKKNEAHDQKKKGITQAGGSNAARGENDGKGPRRKEKPKKSVYKKVWEEK